MKVQNEREREEKTNESADASHIHTYTYIACRKKITAWCFSHIIIYEIRNICKKEKNGNAWRQWFFFCWGVETYALILLPRLVLTNKGMHVLAHVTSKVWKMNVCYVWALYWFLSFTLFINSFHSFFHGKEVKNK